MNALAELLRSLVQPWLESPGWASLIGSVLSLAGAFVASLLVYRFLQAVAKRLSPGPVFMFGALVVGGVYLLLHAYLWATGRSFEAGVLEWLTGFTGLPLHGLGVYARPMLFSLFFVLIHGSYLLVVVLAGWAFGLLSPSADPGGVIREIEAELGTSFGMRFYKLCGYYRPDAPEKRFHAWASEIARVLRWAKWLSLAGVFTGAVPVALWIVGAVMIDGWNRNLTPPPTEPEEEAREEDAAAAALPALRNPAQLVQALQADARGPQLRMVGGGQLPGRAEHAAQTTRIKVESLLFADVLSQLGIEGFYVHQEAAAEAILDGKDVLMETPPLSGRRTLCDVLAMRAVLLEGGTALYISPSARESARRAKAFRDVAQRSNWRWAIFHHDIADAGREGLDLKLRQPQIVFTTPEELHDDICRLHGDWDYFLQSLALIAAIDLDRYTGPRGANLMYLLRRLSRVARAAGAEPRVLATVAPFGPDVQGFAERLVGRPLTVVGPESDSRGAPAQYVVVGEPTEAKSLHPAVAARGVAIACGYHGEIWGHNAVLTDFEQDQQVNKVLLEFNRAVVSASDDSDLRFDRADAIVARMSSAKAAMIPFFTRHVGRKTLGVESLSALEVGQRKGDEARPDLPFVGFGRFEESADLGKKGKRLDEAPKDDARAAEAPAGEPADPGATDDAAAEQLAQALEQSPDVAVAIWLADDDSFSRYLARNPGFVHPQQMHPMMKLGSKLVASADNAAITVRHLLCAAGETPITRSEAAQLFSTQALDAVLGAPAKSEELAGVTERLIVRPRLHLEADGVIVQDDELVLEGELMSRGSTEVASVETARLVNRAGGEVVMTTDRNRILAVAYPGRVLIAQGRRYKVLLPDEQQRLDEGVVWAEPERRRVVSSRVRRVEVEHGGSGHELKLGGARPVRFHHEKIALTETVIGVRYMQEAREYFDTLHYDAPVVVRYPTRAAIVHLPEAAPEALEALERLVRVTLPAFVRHGEEDIDVVALHHGGGGKLLFIDRHPGSTGFARAVTSDVLRHALHWSRALVVACQGPGCAQNDGCIACVFGSPRLTPDSGPAVSRTRAIALLDAILGQR